MEVPAEPRGPDGVPPLDGEREETLDLVAFGARGPLGRARVDYRRGKRVTGEVVLDDLRAMDVTAEHGEKVRRGGGEVGSADDLLRSSRKVNSCAPTRAPSTA